jgi:prophage maintenance system killer protein
MDSPRQTKRPSLTNLFTDLTIKATTSSPSRSLSPKKRAQMMDDLRQTISKGWPPKLEVSEQAMQLTIRSDGVYREYAPGQDPKKQFEMAATWIEALQSKIIDDSGQDIIMKEVQEAIIRAIFGSNQIERAGLGLDLTIQMCRQVFAGEEVPTFPESDPDYQEKLLELCLKKQPDLKGRSAQYILRSRNEVVQHAKAYQHIIHAVVVKKQYLTEDLIKETHQMLTRGVPIVEEGMSDVPPEQYGGIYRTVIVQAGTTNFTVPKFIPQEMNRMCAELQADFDKAAATGVVDPFSLAANYSLKFVQIHPFRDGNGRMCRMILNAILCRFTGVVIPIGEQGEERKEYMDIKKRASAQMEGHGEFATFTLKRACTRLREMKKKLAGKGGSSGA